MDRNLKSDADLPVAADNPEAKWILWGIWAGISLVIVLLAVLVAGLDTVLLLVWMVGIIITAMLMVFRR